MQSFPLDLGMAKRGARLNYVAISLIQAGKGAVPERKDFPQIYVRNSCRNCQLTAWVYNIRSQGGRHAADYLEK